MQSLPQGILTFLLTDIEGSTPLWEDAPDSMMEAIKQHDSTIDEAIEAFGGVNVRSRGEGDSRFIVFVSASDAVAAASRMQINLSNVDWVTPRPIKVRASLHTGAAELQLGEYYGSTVNRAARLRGIAHGGQTVLSASTWELARDSLAEDVTVQDMGLHSLKGLTRPERVYQLNPPGLENVFPPLASLSTTPNNLPLQLTDFVGRQAELAETTRLLDETRLLTILAPGGAGKTRLAIEAAADSIEEYPNGIYFISLAEIGNPDAIVRAIAEGIGLALSTDENEMTQLLTYLANKRMLLVLDNLEHLIDGVGVVAEILAGAPNVTVLATSRARLRITGERTLALGGLGTTWDEPEEATHADGVKLFMEAARRTDPEFVLRPEDLEPLRTILHLTGGMPLAILLAAAWVDILSISAIAEEIQKNLDFLETEAGDVPDRHRSVRAVFDYSWNLLTPDEKDNFAALSVFRGGFTRDAADQVAGATLRNLSSLAAKTLLTPSPDKERYSVHELLRQYAQAELERDQARCDDVQDAHAEYFAEVADNAFSLFALSDEPRLVHQFETELENMRTAWRHLVQRGNATALRKMLPTTHIVYEIQSWYLSGLELVDEVLEALVPDSIDPDVMVTRSLATAVRSWFQALLGRPSVDEVAVANDSLRESGDLVALWVGLQSEALNCTYLGLFDEMIEVTDEIISLGRRMDDTFYGVGGHNWRSRAAMYTGDYETAKRLLTEAIKVFEKRDEYYFMIWNLGLQAAIATLEGQPEQALPLTSRQVERARKLGYRRGLAVALHSLGQASMAVGDLDGAEEAFIEAAITCEKIGMVVDMIGLMANVARARALMGRSVEAVELLATVLGEPLSKQQGIMDNLPVAALAGEWLKELRTEMDPDQFAESKARGTACTYELAMQEMIEQAPRH
jgi:predicted ATPase/class 3 adenylate cyclase